MKLYKVTGSATIEASDETYARARVAQYVGTDVEIHSIEELGEVPSSRYVFATDSEMDAIVALLANLRGATVEVPSEVPADV